MVEQTLITVLCQTMIELINLFQGGEKDPNPEVEQLKNRHKCLRDYVCVTSLQKTKPFDLKTNEWMTTFLDLCDAREKYIDGLSPLLNRVWDMRNELLTKMNSNEFVKSKVVQRRMEKLMYKPAP